MNRHASIGYWPGESGILPGEAWLGWSRHGFPAGGIMPAPILAAVRCLARRRSAQQGTVRQCSEWCGGSWMPRSAANPTTKPRGCASPGMVRRGLAGFCDAGLGPARIPSAADNPRTNNRGQVRHGNARLYAEKMGSARIPSAGDNRRTTTNPTGLARMERPGDAWRVQVRLGMAGMPTRPANGGTIGAMQCTGLFGPGLEPPGKDSAPSG